MIVRAVVIARITVAAAAIVGSVSRVTEEYIRTGSVCRYGLWMNRDNTTSSKLVANANSAPDSTPGATSGKVTVRKVLHRFAPQIAAASSRRRSTLSNATRIESGTFDLEVDLHTPQGTVGGATIGLLAELAATDLVSDLVGDAGRPVALDELDVRFVNKVRGGPIRASATALGQRGDATTVRVEIVDVGNNHRLTSYALAVCRSAG